LVIDKQRPINNEQLSPGALTESRRRAVFATLVRSQDNGAPVRQSRRLTAVCFGVTLIEVLAIEREGLDNRWPPLRGAG
jgi:hypothetical protein